MMFEQYDDVVNVEGLCEMLSIGKNAAYSLLSSGQVKAFRYNRVWKIPKQGVIEYVLSQSNLA
ncbi:MAG: helix-turn-helix domain-containing protein [Veillonellales bacterium]